MKSLADNLIIFHKNGTDHGVRTNQANAFARQFQNALQVLSVLLEHEGGRRSVKQRIDKRGRVKRHQIPDLLPGSYEANRQSEFARNGHDDAPLGCPLELSENNASNADGVCKLTSLAESILSGGRVHHQKYIVR